jgi:hypothetical protein
MRQVPTLLMATMVGLGACGSPDADAPEMGDAGPVAAESPQDAFWQKLQSLCPGAADGELVRAPEGDSQIAADARLVVHFWECGEEELRFPLHVGQNRSRTWVFIRHEDHLELRHDHRHEDGTEEEEPATWYGASTMAQGTANQQEFLFDRDGMTVGWRVEIEPGQRFTYGTIREGEWRHHMEFDLTSEAETPPLPWGHETRPSQRPTPEGGVVR